MIKISVIDSKMQSSLLLIAGYIDINTLEIYELFNTVVFVFIQILQIERSEQSCESKFVLNVCIYTPLQETFSSVTFLFPNSSVKSSALESFISGVHISTSINQNINDF